MVAETAGDLRLNNVYDQRQTQVRNIYSFEIFAAPTEADKGDSQEVSRGLPTPTHPLQRPRGEGDFCEEELS